MSVLALKGMLILQRENSEAVASEEREEFKKAVEEAGKRALCAVGLCAEGMAPCQAGGCATGTGTCQGGLRFEERACAKGVADLV